MLFYYRTLNKSLKKKLENRSLNETELKSIWHNIQEDNIKKKRIFHIAMLGVAACMFLCALLIGISMKDHKATLLLVLISPISVGILYIYLKWSLFSLFKSQYNRCIRKYYPEYDGIYTL